MRPRIEARMALGVLIAAGVTGGCDQDPASPDTPTSAASVTTAAPAPPAGLATIVAGGGPIDVWPFTGVDLAGNSADPLMFVFAGHVDVLSLRAALVELNGDRTAFGLPNAFPFNCTWTDANGGIQTVYTSSGGWAANPVQLECGGYAPVRFHVRLFAAGDKVVGGAHFEVLIPGTPQHQVISWELARQLVIVDFLRSGRLGAVAPLGGTQVISPAPSFRTIPAVIYDGLPAALKGAIGGPPSSGGTDVPIPSTGRATILNVANAAAVVDAFTSSDFTLPFSQLVPRPFCSQGPTDFVRVEGQIRITTSVRIANGNLSSHNTLGGDVRATPFDIFNGVPSGETFSAQVSNTYLTSAGPGGAGVNVIERLLAIPPPADERGSLTVHLNTAPNGAAHYSRRERC